MEIDYTRLLKVVLVIVGIALLFWYKMRFKKDK
jgi:hypothetical protein